jgi:hypothetical protein
MHTSLTKPFTHHLLHFSCVPEVIQTEDDLRVGEKHVTVPGTDVHNFASERILSKFYFDITFC